MTKIINCMDISLKFQVNDKNLFVLNKLNFEIEEEEIICILGTSGCGKTSLLNIISGLNSPSSGKVIFKGKEIKGINTEVGYITQEDTLLPWRTVLKNILIPLELKKNKEKNLIDPRILIKKIELEGFENYYPHELSGGMRKRVMLIRTLLYDPSVILMDEPFASLDVLTRLKLWDFTLKLCSEYRKTIIVVTHDISEAITLSDRIIILSRRPATIKKEYIVELTRPRDVYSIQTNNKFQELYQEIWENLKDEAGV